MKAETPLKHVRYIRQDDTAGRREVIAAGYTSRGIDKKGYEVFILGLVEPEVIEAAATTFGVERDLQDALRASIEQLEKGLKITDGGKEQHVPSGYIDITARDHKGVTVVIELKAGVADREAVAQILSYMGDLSQGKKPIRGILIAGQFPSRTISAARAVPNLQLQKYGYKFTFQRIGKEKK
jgi:endonuclease